MCLLAALYPDKTFQRQSEKAGREFSFGKGRRNVTGVLFVCLFSVCYCGSSVKLFYCYIQQQTLKKKNVCCTQYLLNKFLEKYNTWKKEIKLEITLKCIWSLHVFCDMIVVSFLSACFTMVTSVTGVGNTTPTLVFCFSLSL